MTTLTIVLVAVAGFLAFWAGVVSLIGAMGWKPLARRYPAARWPEGEGRSLGWQSARVGLSRYNNVLNAALAVEGLYLRPVRFFAYNHPPIFIPWGAVRRTEPGLFGSLRLGLEGGGSLALRGRLAREVEAALDAWASAAVPAETPDAATLAPSDALPDDALARALRRQRT